jgi:hypothetical protein
MTPRLALPIFALLALSFVSAPAKAAVLPANTTAILSGGSSLFDEFSAPTNFSFTSRQAVSQNGAFATFVSQSDGLSNQDDDSVDNIYVKDTTTGAVTFVNRRSGAGGAPSPSSCGNPVISDDGTRVAFICAGSLDPADTNNVDDIYVRDLTTDQTILVSRQSGDGPVGNSESRSPSINQDGTKIAFGSGATNLGAVNGQQVFVADTSQHTTTLVSDPPTTNDPPNEVSLDPSISNDGNSVAFESGASNLVGGDTNNTADVFVRTMSTGAIVLASRATGAAGAIGDHLSADAQISGDGGTVVFTSSATNLAPTLDSDTTSDVYKRTLTGAPTTALVDVTGTTKSNHGADFAAVDDTGSVIAFESFATNFDPAVAGPDEHSEIYVSTNGGAPALVSRATGATGAPSTTAVDTSVSGNGHWVGFGSDKSVTGDDLRNRIDTVNLRFLPGQITNLVSRPPGTDPLVNQANDSFYGAVSANGHFVAFATDSAGLGVPPGVKNAIVVRNTVTGQATIASRADGPDGALMNDVLTPSISADGNRVAFEEDGPNGKGLIWLRDLRTNQTIRVDRADGEAGDLANDDSENPSIDAAGDKVAFESQATNLSPDDTDTHDDVFVRDITRSTTTLASRAMNGDKGDDDSFLPSLSADGDHLAFGSDADNLGDGDTDKTEDIHVRDLSEGTTRLASVSSSGQKGDRNSDSPSISGDGSRVAFDSNATNFGSTQNQVSEVWVHDFGSGQTVGASRADGPGGDFMSTPSAQPWLSADGRVVAFSSGTPVVMLRRLMPRGVFPQSFTGYRRDLAANATSVVSRGPGPDGATAPTGFVTGISADGACVAFNAFGGLVQNALGAEDYQQVYMRTFGPNCAAPAADNSPARDTTAPVLRSVSLTHSRFRVAKAATQIARKIPRGTQLRFTASEASKLSILIQRVVPGKKARKGKKRICKPVHKQPKHGACKALRRRATLTRNIAAGRGRVSLTGRIGKRRMAPGRYRLTITATDGAGNRSKAIHRSFTILAG